MPCGPGLPSKLTGRPCPAILVNDEAVETCDFTEISLARVASPCFTAGFEAMLPVQMNQMDKGQSGRPVWITDVNYMTRSPPYISFAIRSGLTLGYEARPFQLA